LERIANLLGKGARDRHPLLLRFAIDDLKAYVLEAAAALPSRPSSRQLGDGLWDETGLGAAIHALEPSF
jgi:hypothetical protein